MWHISRMIPNFWTVKYTSGHVSVRHCCQHTCTVLGVMLSPWDERICKDCTCDLLVTESPVSLVSFCLTAFSENCFSYISLMVCVSGVGVFDHESHMFMLSHRRACHSSVHCCCRSGTWKQAPLWWMWWCMKWNAWTSAHGVADPTAPCTASTAFSV